MDLFLSKSKELNCFTHVIRASTSKKSLLNQSYFVSEKFSFRISNFFFGVRFLSLVQFADTNPKESYIRSCFPYLLSYAHFYNTELN